MTGEKTFRLSQVARKLNVGTATIAETLVSKGFEIENSPNSKITIEQFDMLSKEFESSAMDKEEAHGLMIGQKHADNMVIDSDSGIGSRKKVDEEEFFIKDNSLDQETIEAPEGEEEIREEEIREEEIREDKEEKEEEKSDETAPAQEITEIVAEEPARTDPPEEVETPKLRGVKVLGKIDLDETKPPEPTPKETEEPVEEVSEDKVEDEIPIEASAPSEGSPVETEEAPAPPERNP